MYVYTLKLVPKSASCPTLTPISIVPFIISVANNQLGTFKLHAVIIHCIESFTLQSEKKNSLSCSNLQFVSNETMYQEAGTCHRIYFNSALLSQVQKLGKPKNKYIQVYAGDLVVCGFWQWGRLK